MTERATTEHYITVRNPKTANNQPNRTIPRCYIGHKFKFDKHR